MLRFILLILAGILVATSAAWGHDLPGEHTHPDTPLPIAEICAGLALILSAASFWLSWRTRRLVADALEPH